MIVTVFPNEKAVEVAVATKCGCSTVVDVLGYPHFNGFRARSGRAKLLKEKKYFRNIDRYTEDFPIVSKIAVVRDPVERLASCFADRILKKNRNGMREHITSFDYLVNNLESLQKQFVDLRQHSRPQVMWLGEDPTYYDHIFTTKDLQTGFTPVISKISGVEIPQTSHRKPTGRLKNTFEVTDQQKKIIKEFYEDDYKFWGDYFS